MHALTEDGGRRFDAFWSWVDAQRTHESLAPGLGRGRTGVQGRGIGRALIERGLTRARAAGSGVLLEQEAFVTFRSMSVGFRTCLADDAPDGGPHVWFMRWDP